MDVQLLTQADYILSKCGRPMAPTGLSAVYIYKSFLIQQFFGVSPANPAAVLEKEITGASSWVLRAISCATSVTTGLSFQVMLPNGRFLINNLQDILQVAGYGSYRYLFAKELECPPGSKLQVTFADTAIASAQPIAVLFEGAYKVLVKGGAQQICMAQDAAARMPRYLRNFSENIMAPCWAQGIGPATPAGLRDEEWVYSAAGQVTLPSGVALQGATAIDVANGPFQNTQVIPIDSGSDFRCRKLLFQITADETVTAGTILCKIRTGSGYAFFDDYFDPQLIGSSPMPHDWEIRAADTVYVDMQLVDQAGTGNIYLQSYLEGTKRFRA